MILDLTCGQAATVIFAQCLAAKLYMTLVARFGVFSKVLPMPEDFTFAANTEKAKKVQTEFEKNSFIYTHRAQLNDAEYAGPNIAVLLFLESQKVAAPVACKLLAFGAVVYFWAQILTQHRLAQPIGALPRYAGMGCLVFALYGHFF